MNRIRETGQGFEFKIIVQPRSSKNQIVGPHGDAFKIRLTAPPVDNAANVQCVKFLAKTLNIPKSSIDIISGHTGRTKRIRLRYPDGRTGSPEKSGLRKTLAAVLKNEASK